MIPSPFIYPPASYAAYPPVTPVPRRAFPNPNPFAATPARYPQQRRTYFQQQGVAQPNALPAFAFQQRIPQQPMQQVTLTAQRHTIATSKKPKVHPIGFLFPAMTLIGTPLMLFSSILGVHPPDPKKVAAGAAKELEFNPNWITHKAVTLLQKLQKKNVVPLTNKAIKEAYGPFLRKSYRAGKVLLALGIIPKTIIGMVYGIRAQQPSILFSHLLQLPLTPLILRDNPIATSLAYMMGGLFTLGFINDVENGQIKEGQRDPRKGGPRFYDMTRFKRIFQSDSGLSAFQRMTGFIGETFGMACFVIADHLRTTKRALVDLYTLAFGKKSNLKGTDSTSSTAKSGLGFLLCYMATIPSILANWLCKDSKSTLAHAISRYSMATTILSGLMLNFGMILVALTGKNWAERLPLMGTTMELSGTVAGYAPNEKVRPFALALQQLGAGINSVFFANQAEKSKSPN
jgi:hypothetical protein